MGDITKSYIRFDVEISGYSIWALSTRHSGALLSPMKSFILQINDRLLYATMCTYSHWHKWNTGVFEILCDERFQTSLAISAHLNRFGE